MRNQSMFEKLKAQAEKAKNGTPSYKEGQENIWKLEADKAGNASAVIRFLPGKDEDSVAWVKVFNHGFKGPTGQWFIEPCPTTVGDQCIVCTANSVLWNEGSEASKKIVSARKRKTKYYTNVLIISDPKNPDNEGKVMIFSFGSKIFDMINACFSPEDADDTPFNPFDIEDGANFKLKMCQVAGYANFDKSKFADCSKAEIVDYASKLHDLGQFIDPKVFKSEEDMQKRFDLVLKGDARASGKATMPEEDDDEEYAALAAKVAAKPVKSTAARSLPEEDDDDMMAEFQRLAED